MNPNNRRLQIDLAAARYLEAFERDNFTDMADIWQLALADPELESALREIHAGLVEEQAREAAAIASAMVRSTVETHLPSAEIVGPSTGPVTVGEVAEEMFRHAPDRLPAEAHVLNEQLRTSREPLPEDLGLSRLIGWAEKLFGSAPSDYWKAFRQTAVKLELRRNAEAEYQLAARRAPRPEEKQ